MKQQAEIFDLPFFTDKFRLAWEKWIQYRKERRLPKYVPTGLKATFSKLLHDSNGNEETAIKIIENSISCNWQGLHRIKEEIRIPAPVIPIESLSEKEKNQNPNK